MVSKSWRSAAKHAFLGNVTIDVTDSNAGALALFCKTLPLTSQLTVQSHGVKIDMSPISCCTRLSSLLLEVKENRAPQTMHQLDLTKLPKSLRSLQTVLYCIFPASLPQDSCVGLTKLQMRMEGNIHKSICPMLQYLPKLKV